MWRRGWRQIRRIRLVSSDHGHSSPRTDDVIELVRGIVAEQAAAFENATGLACSSDVSYSAFGHGLVSVVMRVKYDGDLPSETSATLAGRIYDALREEVPERIRDSYVVDVGVYASP